MKPNASKEPPKKLAPTQTAKWLQDANKSENPAIVTLLVVRNQLFIQGINTLPIQQCIKSYLKADRQS